MTDLDPDRVAQAAQAYLYGYPLVYCLDEIAKIPAGSPLLDGPAPFNSFGAARHLLDPDAEFVTPNNDTLYLIGALDLSGGPVELTVPDTGDRYYVLQFVDAWSNNVAYVGTRATGNRAGSFLIVPAGWTGDAPGGTPIVEMPTSVGVIVGRIAVSGYASIIVAVLVLGGLQLLSLEERNPLLTSTYGTGELLLDAKARGATTALLAIGGSATNDAGIGMAAALGWQFLDANGNAVKPDGGNLQQIARIIAPASLPFEKVEVLCDVTNPLFGPNGASWIYGPQKGGNSESLTHLDSGARHIARLVEEQLGKTGLADTPGAGAAGGLGFGGMAFLDATLKRGIEMVLDLVGFDAAAASADLVITGEGCIDGQSLQGKLIQGVSGRAGATPVVALCGKLSASESDIRAVGLKAAYSINKEQRPLSEMLPPDGLPVPLTCVVFPF